MDDYDLEDILRLAANDPEFAATLTDEYKLAADLLDKLWHENDELRRIANNLTKRLLELEALEAVKPGTTFV